MPKCGKEDLAASAGDGRPALMMAGQKGEKER